MNIPTERFLEKNEDNFKKLDDFIAQNNDICLMLISPEMFEYLKYFNLLDLKNDFSTYKKVRIMVDDYHPTKVVDFVLKEPRIKFDLPCICGFYEDEEHK